MILPIPVISGCKLKYYKTKSSFYSDFNVTPPLNSNFNFTVNSVNQSKSFHYNCLCNMTSMQLGDIHIHVYGSDIN